MLRTQIWFLVVLLVLVSVASVRCGTVLTIITPGPKSHLFGMKKITQALEGQGHSVAVGTLEHILMQTTGHSELGYLTINPVLLI